VCSKCKGLNVSRNHCHPDRPDPQLKKKLTQRQRGLVRKEVLGHAQRGFRSFMPTRRATCGIVVFLPVQLVSGWHYQFRVFHRCGIRIELPQILSEWFAAEGLGCEILNQCETILSRMCTQRYPDVYVSCPNYKIKPICLTEAL
jgi:hypothetical protein